MSLSIVFWIIACALLSLGVVYLSYFYRSMSIFQRGILSLLRFVGVFGLLLLLVNPGIVVKDNVLQKYNLVVLFDNSASMQVELQRNQLLSIKQKINDNEALKQRFNVSHYSFGHQLNLGDSLSFQETTTDLNAALSLLQKTHNKEETLILAITDGQQNTGRDYTTPEQYGSKIYPLAVGDTSKFKDLRINQININRYALLGNQFPVELLYSYYGQNNAESVIQIYDNDKLVNEEPLRLINSDLSGRHTVNLDATSEGLHQIRVTLKPLEEEKNKVNNTRVVGLEVLDDRFRIVVVSNGAHPDIGALKRSILSRPQREFQFFNPNKALESPLKGDLYILFNPNANFESLYNTLIASGTPTLTIAGSQTDWEFLNGIQEAFRFEDSGLTELFLPDWNTNFNYFSNDVLKDLDLPPLEGNLGTFEMQSEYQVLLFKSFRGESTVDPLITLIRSGRREGIILGTGLWKWRMQDFRAHGNFDAFDSFFNAIWLFLGANGASGRFTLEYQTLYHDLLNASISAHFFDEAYRFDPSTTIELQLEDSLGVKQVPIRFSLINDRYQASLSALKPGNYKFKAQVLNSNFSRTGQFTIQKMDLESMNLGANIAALNQLANNTGGKLYFQDQADELVAHLLASNEYIPIQKSRRKVVSLVNFSWIYFLISFALIGEWFLRKYHGLV